MLSLKTLALSEFADQSVEIRVMLENEIDILNQKITEKIKRGDKNDKMQIATQHVCLCCFF